MTPSQALDNVCEHHLRVMGTDAQILVVGGDRALPEAAAAHLVDLERRWSRFIASSEISILNRNAGRLLAVSADTYELIARAVAAWRMTRGRFDPTVGAALAA